MLQLTPTAPRTTKVETPTPASLTVWCEPCGANTQLRPDGEKACCWSGRIADSLDRYRRFGVTRPSQEIRQMVAAALGRTDAVTAPPGEENQ